VADDAGALLVRSGLITPGALADARARTESHGGTIGEQLVVMGALGDEALTDFYRSRLLVPQVNPNTLARLPIKVVAAIPSDMAIELRAVPVALDAENNLTVAMSDPSDRNAVDEITWFTGAYVVRAVATQMQIAWCLAHYYGHVTALGQRLMQQTGTAAPVSPPVTRTKGMTGKVEAMRHRAMAPITGPVNVPRPTSGQIAVPSSAAAAAQAPTVPPIAEPVAAPAGPVSGPHGVPTASPTAKTLPPIAPASPAVQRSLGVDDSTPRIEQAVRAVSQPDTADNSDGVPDRPRARTASGEIRVPGRRAPSIKPPVPEPHGDDDESGPVMTIEVNDDPIEDETAPRKMVPVRKRKAKTDPPELAARAGEVELHTGPIRKATVDEEPKIIIGDLEDHPTMAVTETSGELRVLARPEPSSAAPSATIEVSEETSAGVVITEQPYRDSQPVLLERRRPSDQPANQVPVARQPIEPEPEADDEGEVIVLAPKAKAAVVRTPKHTQIGIGALPAATAVRSHRDTETSGIPDALDDAPTGEAHVRDTDATIVTQAAPRGEDHTPTGDRLVAPPSPDDTDSGLAPPPPPVRHDPDVDDEPAAPPPPSKPEPMKLDYDPLDDGWGPPGTTIPPPLLGSVPGSDDPGMGRIPVSNVDAQPLIVAPAVPPEAVRSGGVQTPARALEDATARLIEVIRQLDHAETRDDVVNIMIAHLAETHTRAGFFVIKRDELSAYAIQPRPPTQPFGALKLDRPSTLADIVGTRLPYRGPIPDETSRQFLTAVLGMCPAEILLVPVAVRERVVGVLFGEARTRHTFDDQLAFASRAAGMALERILKARRG